MALKSKKQMLMMKVTKRVVGNLRLKELDLNIQNMMMQRQKLLLGLQLILQGEA